MDTEPKARGTRQVSLTGLTDGTSPSVKPVSDDDADEPSILGGHAGDMAWPVRLPIGETFSRVLASLFLLLNSLPFLSFFLVRPLLLSFPGCRLSSILLAAADKWFSLRLVSSRFLCSSRVVAAVVAMSLGACVRGLSFAGCYTLLAEADGKVPFTSGPARDGVRPCRPVMAAA